MKISRAGLLRGAFAATALLPAASLAKPTPEGAFQSNLAVGGAHPWTRAPRLGGGGPLRFAVIGDNTGLARPGVFDHAMTQLNWLQPDFVLSVGDLIEGYTDDRTKIAAQWSAVESSIAKLSCPFIFTPGNHDVNNAETLDAWRERRGATYYSFTYKGALFLILSTEDTPQPMPANIASQFYSLIDLMKTDPDRATKSVEGRISASGGLHEYGKAETVTFSEKQLGWIRDTLAKHPKPTWTFVVLHKPAWKMQSPDFAKIQAMVADRPHTVIAGHTHYFTHEVSNGHDYINMGTTGGIMHEAGPGTMDHTMFVTLGQGGPTYANIRVGGLMDVAGQTGQLRTY